MNQISSIGAKLQSSFPNLRDLLPIQILGEGFGSYVVEGNDGIVFRIAKNKIVQKLYKRQSKLLPILKRHIVGFTIPDPEFYIEQSNVFPFGLIGYRKIEGVILQPEDIDESNRKAIASQIAEFMYQLHHIKVSEELKDIDLPQLSSQNELESLQKKTFDYLKRHLHTEEYGALERWWKDTCNFLQLHEREPVLVHGDLWFENIVTNEKRIKILGILDFDNVAFDDPATDFVPQRYIGKTFEDDVVRHYQNIGGHLGDNFAERVSKLMGLRELRGLVYGIETNYIDEDSLSKIRNTIIRNTF